MKKISSLTQNARKVINQDEGRSLYRNVRDNLQRKYGRTRK